MSESGPTSSCLIAMTQRSGSTMLCRALADTGVAGRPEEYFLDGDPAAFPPGWSFWEDGIFSKPGMSRAEFLEHVHARGTTPNGVFGAKLAWNNIAWVLRRLRAVPRFAGLGRSAALHALFPDLHVVHLVRRDRVAQAVSWARAAQDGVWVVSDLEAARPVAEPEYDYELISNLERLIIEGERGWRRLCTELDVSPLAVAYEDLAASDTYEQVVRSVLRHLDVDLTIATVRPPRTERQSDDLNLEWCDRYRADKGVV